MPAMDENVIKRIMPHSLEAEQSVIGSMFIDAEAIAAATEQISGEDFYNRQYGVVFDTIVELNNEGKPIDFVTLQDRLRSKEDVPPEVSGLDFLTNLIAAVPTSANIKYYAGIVAEKATLRRLIRTNEEIANTCYLDKQSTEEIMEETEKKIFQLLQRRTSGEFVPIQQIVLNAVSNIERASKTKGSVTGLPTGFVDLDYKTSKFRFNFDSCQAFHGKNRVYPKYCSVHGSKKEYHSGDFQPRDVKGTAGQPTVGQ